MSFIKDFINSWKTATTKDEQGNSLLGNALSKFWYGVTNGVSNWWKGFTGSGLTQRDIELNAMSMQNIEDTAQAQVAGYQKAGLNPALMMSGGSQSAPQASSTGSVGNMSELMQLLLLPAQLKALSAQTENTEARTSQVEAKTKETFSKIDRLRAEISGLNLDNDKKAILLNYVERQQELELEIGSATVDEKRASIESIFASIDKMDMEQCKIMYECLEAQENINLMYSKSMLNVAECEQIAHNIDYIDSRKQLVNLNIRDWNFINVLGSASSSSGILGIRGSESKPITLQDLKDALQEREKDISGPENSNSSDKPTGETSIRSPFSLYRNWKERERKKYGYQ